MYFPASNMALSLGIHPLNLPVSKAVVLRRHAVCFGRSTGRDVERPQRVGGVRMRWVFDEGLYRGYMYTNTPKSLEQYQGIHVIICPFGKERFMLRSIQISGPL